MWPTEVLKGLLNEAPSLVANMAIIQLIVAFRAIVDVIGLPGNLLVIATVSVERRFHTVPYVLLASLAVSDELCLTAINTYTLDCMIQAKWLYSETVCHLHSYFSRYFYINTVLHLVAVSYERYRAIVKEPMTYDGTMSKYKMMYMALLWIIPIPLCIGPFFGWGAYVYNPNLFLCEQGWSVQSESQMGITVFFGVLFFALPFLFILFLNWSIFKTASRIQQNELVPQHMLNSNESQNEAVARRIRDRKAAVDVSIVVGAFLVCFIPIWTVGVCRQTMKNTEDVPVLAIMIAHAITMVNSMVNSIIYSIRKQAFRDGVKKMMRRIGFLPRSNTGDNGIMNRNEIGTNNQGRSDALPLGTSSMQQQSPIQAQ